MNGRTTDLVGALCEEVVRLRSSTIDRYERDLSDERDRAEIAEANLEKARAEVKRWENSEVDRAVCCTKNEVEVNRLTAELETVRARLAGSSEANEILREQVAARLAGFSEANEILRERVDAAENKLEEVEVQMDQWSVRCPCECEACNILVRQTDAVLR